MTLHPPREIFTYFSFKLDITKALRDLEAGAVRPKELDLAPSFVTEYAERILCLNREERDEQSSLSFFMSVDAKRALELPGAVLDTPVLLMNLGPGKGLLSFAGNPKPDEVLADGNHRLARAFFEERATPLKALLFSRAQTRKYQL